MRPIPVLLVSLLPGILGGEQLGGQEALRSKLGFRVRVEIAEGQPFTYGSAESLVGAGQFITGRLRSVSDTLTVLFDPEHDVEVLIPTESIARAESYSGQGSHGSRGFGLGFLVGAIGGGISGWDEGADDPSKCWIFCMTKPESAFLGVVAFGLAGGLIGLTIGSFIETDRWDLLALPDVWGSTQLDGTVGLGVTLPVGLKPRRES